MGWFWADSDVSVVNARTTPHPLVTPDSQPPVNTSYSLFTKAILTSSSQHAQCTTLPSKSPQPNLPPR